MKKAHIYIVLIIAAFILSCHSNSKQDILTGGNYKYWLITNAAGKDKQIAYFDKNGKCLPFVESLNGGFEKYDGRGVKLPSYWNMPKYNLFNWGVENYKIIKLTDSVFIVEHGTIDTLIPAPDALIPINFRKLQ
jgi:hypothetical protein